MGERDHLLVKLLCANSGRSFQYELLNEAVEWATGRQNPLIPVVNQRNGVYKSYYVSQAGGD